MFQISKSALSRAVSAEIWVGADAAKRVKAALWNAAAIATPRALIVCQTVDDVQRAVGFAANNDVGISVLSGGHDWAGRAACPDGIVLDIRALNTVVHEAGSMTVRVGGGALTKELVVGLPLDVAAVTGTVSTVGVAGLLLGGGYGKLNSRFGLAIDTLRSADVVLADGSLVTASETTEQDLFWALRGGGGNFGVVTSLALDTFSVLSVLTATIVVPLALARPALLQLQEIIDQSPDELSVLSAILTVPEAGVVLMLAPLWSGAEAPGEMWIDKLASIDGAKTVARAWSNYRGTFDDEAEKAFPKGSSYQMDAQNLSTIDEATAEALIECATNFPSALSKLILHDFHGAPTRVAADATSFALRRKHFNLEILASWTETDDQESDKQIDWLTTSSQRFSRHAFPGG